MNILQRRSIDAGVRADSFGRLQGPEMSKRSYRHDPNVEHSNSGKISENSVVFEWKKQNGILKLGKPDLLIQILKGIGNPNHFGESGSRLEVRPRGE